MTEDTLEFDRDEHIYRQNGAVLPGVTSVLSTQFPLNVSRERLEFARQLGSAIHAACELFDRGTLDFNSVDHRVVPYLGAWRSFREQTKWEIVEIELRVHHPVLHYAGTLDRIVRVDDGTLGVLDLKRPRLDARAGVQLAGYAAAYNETVLRRVKRHENVLASKAGRAFKADVVEHRFGLQLRDDGSYRLREYRDRSDWEIFKCCLSLLNWRQQHN